MAGALFLFDVFEPDAKSSAQAAARLFDAAQEAWVMFETVFEPVILRFKADEHACRFTMTGYDDFLGRRLAKEARQIVLDFGQGDFLHAGFPNCASHNSASDLATIAKTSTVVPETS
ncbi:hypothetical protein V1279_006955 [Bradyrhizobium sp. AZCC 1610]|jgi:hypothetical protein|uniref:hypothetical protein n=1 Tax=Bradyrhizobium sp. AZCC 1610 TaxID=3117020 RepID=UPI0030525A96